MAQCLLTKLRRSKLSLNQVQCFHKHLCLVGSEVGQNPLIRQAENRCFLAVYPLFFSFMLCLSNEKLQFAKKLITCRHTYFG